MDKYFETIKTWDKVAELYQEKFMDLDIYNNTYDAFIHKINAESASILELGCGPGNIAKYLLKHCPNWQYDVTDASENMVQLAKKNVPLANCFVLDVHNLSQLNKAYNGIVLGFILPYITNENLAVFFQEINRLTLLNAILYLSFVEGKPSASGWKTNSKGDRIYFNYHTSQNLTNLLQKNGFKIEVIELVNYPKSLTDKEVHTVMLARKGE